MSTRPRVLLAETDGGALERMRRFLLHRDYAVATATGGVECLAQLRRCDDPILVLDVALAWGGGDGVLAVMRENSALARIPVVLTSTNPDGDAARFGRPPVLCVLEKPFSLDALLDCIRTTQRLMMWARNGTRSPQTMRSEPEDRM